MRILQTTLQLLLLPITVFGGWGSSSGEKDVTLYGDSFTRDWLYESTGISMKVEGCMWGYVYDSEEAGCLEDSSEDGTTYWYQMANCRRAQAVYSLYADSSSSSASCNQNSYKETLVTTLGLPEFIEWLKENDQYSPFNEDADDDDGYGGWDLDELPLCEQAEDGYIGLGCNDDGTFSLNTYYDQYCLTSTGIYNTLDKLNNQISNYYKDCVALPVNQNNNGGDGDGGGDEDEDLEGIAGLLQYSETCSSVDNSLCTDDTYFTSRMQSSSTGSGRRHSTVSPTARSWHTKLKYAAGAVLLVASFVMFTGILFTNRRRRRALMQRKYRQARRREERSRKSGSRSKSRQRSRSTKRKSKSRERTSASEKNAEGVFT